MIKVQVRASLVRFGDRLVQESHQRAQLVTQVKSRGDEILLSHGSSQTRLTGNPLVWVLRNEPRVIEEELPESIWRPRGPRRTQPWEGSD